MADSVTIGRATLYLGNCREILPALPRPTAIVSDPPYGQGLRTNGTGRHPFGRTLPKAARAMGLRRVPKWADDTIAGDDQPFDPAHLVAAADRVLLWGAHKFGDRLPPGRMLVWDKVPNGKVRNQGDGEAAWCSLDPGAPLRILRLLWDGVCVDSRARAEVTAGQGRVHPAQKPVALMRWCLQFLRLPTGAVICDPYMGSGSTGLAAIEAGHQFIGIELKRDHFETACARLDAAQRQMRLPMEMHA